MALETMTKLGRVDVGAGGQSTIEFTNIPQGYTDLKIIASVRPAALDDMYLKFNGSTSSFTAKRVSGNGSSATSDSSTYWMTPQVASSSVFSVFELTIPNYAGNNFKAFLTEGASSHTSTAAYQSLGAGLWSNPAPVTSVTLYLSSSSFVQYSSATLYGVKAARTVAKATGGDIVQFDGTYWIHTFKSTGSFTPNQSITAEYLILAGAGAGGVDFAGGGGAGGYRTSANSSALSLSPNFGYAITVGAGGTGGTRSNGYDGGSGSPSSISGLGNLISAAGGGGGGSYNGTQNGKPGGSGGGGSGGYGGGGQGNGGAGNTPSVSPAQGYGGGIGYTVPAYGSNRYGGGGGGASGAGGNANSGAFGQGGTGVTTTFGGSSVTYGTGGKGCESQSFSSPVSGSANTGNGGQGGGENVGGGNGGSGIVIIRYKA